MMTVKKIFEKTVKREVCEFDEKIGDWGNVWTRVTVNGDLSKWIPHDDYGEMPNTSFAKTGIKEKLESRYKKHV